MFFKELMISSFQGSMIKFFLFKMLNNVYYTFQLYVR